MTDVGAISVLYVPVITEWANKVWFSRRLSSHNNVYVAASPLIEQLKLAFIYLLYIYELT